MFLVWRQRNITNSVLFIWPLPKDTGRQFKFNFSLSFSGCAQSHGTGGGDEEAKAEDGREIGGWCILTEPVHIRRYTVAASNLSGRTRGVARTAGGAEAPFTRACCCVSSVLKIHGQERAVFKVRLSYSCSNMETSFKLLDSILTFLFCI